MPTCTGFNSDKMGESFTYIPRLIVDIFGYRALGLKLLLPVRMIFNKFVNKKGVL